MSYWKLVGNRVPDNMRKKKREPVVDFVKSPEEHFVRLREKVREEAAEFLTAESVEDMVKESGDLLEAVLTILKLKHIMRGEVFSMVADKLPRVFLEEEERRIRLSEDVDALAKADVTQDIVTLSAAVISSMEAILEFYEKTLEEALEAQEKRLEERGEFDGTLILMEKEGVGVFTPID